MKHKMERTLSRREFAQRAAMLSATAFVPGQIMPPNPATADQNAPASQKLSEGAQTEADSRYQQILSLYSEHLDDTQKANIKRMCAELQPSLERLRNFRLQNSDAPALYLKPLVEREKKPQSAAPPKPAAGAAKP